MGGGNDVKQALGGDDAPPEEFPCHKIKGCKLTVDCGVLPGATRREDRHSEISNAVDDGEAFEELAAFWCLREGGRESMKRS